MEIAQRIQTPDFQVAGEITLKCPEWATAKDAPASERPIIYVTASSTSPDLDCDRMSERALGQMASGFIGLSIFLNHRYAIPEDTFGMVLRTRLIRRDGFLDLDMEIAVETDNPRALQTYKYIQNGQRLGVSVGVLVLKHFTDDGEEQWGQQLIVIDEVVPLEASICGIPSNQRSWVRDAVKSLVDKGVLVLSCDAVGCRPYLKAAALEESTMTIDTKGAVPFKHFPLADRGDAWDANAADKAMRSYAGGPDPEKINWPKYRTGFAWYDADNAETFGAYKLGHHKPETVFKGCAAVAVVLAGGRGGVDIPDADVAGVKSHVGKHYKEFDEQAPWDRPEKGFQWRPEEIEMAKKLDVDLDVAQKNIFPDADKTAACACGQHPEHMSEDDIELTAAVRMMAPPLTAVVEALVTPEMEDTALLKAVNEFLEKAGARNNADDQSTIQECHDLCVKLGAACWAKDDSVKPSTVLTASLAETIAEEMAEQDVREKFWRCTYALTEAIYEILEKAPADARVDALKSVLQEYCNLVLDILQSYPAPDDGEDDDDDGEDTAPSWPTMAHETFHKRYSIVDNQIVINDNVIEEMTVKIAALETERDALIKELETKKLLILGVSKALNAILDKPTPLKTQPATEVRDDVDGVLNQFPELSPVLIQSLTTAKK